MPVAPKPMKIEKTTTAMVDVLWAPVMSKNGLTGMKLKITLGKVTAVALACKFCSTAPCATSAALAVCPTAVNLNRLAMPIPTPAATKVVNIKVPMVSALILPKAAVS